MSEACRCGCKHDKVATVRTTELALALEETVDAAVKRSPGAAAVLRELGIDTCCGGTLTLAQAAASAGIATERVLRALGERAET